MNNIIIKLAANALVLWVAATLVDGITLGGSALGIVIVALVFGLINAIIKPILTILSIPFIVVTLGLFTLVINAGMLRLTAAVTDSLTVSGWGAALYGAIIISIVSWLLSNFLKDDNKKRRR